MRYSNKGPTVDWEWTDKTPMKYINWEKGEPDTSEDRCGRILVNNDNSYSWWGERCHEKMWAVCQKSVYD